MYWAEDWNCLVYIPWVNHIYHVHIRKNENATGVPVMQEHASTCNYMQLIISQLGISWISWPAGCNRLVGWRAGGLPVGYRWATGRLFRIPRARVLCPAMHLATRGACNSGGPWLASLADSETDSSPSLVQPVSSPIFSYLPSSALYSGGGC